MADFFSSQYFPFLILHCPQYKPELSIKGNKCKILGLINWKPHNASYKINVCHDLSMSKHIYKHKNCIRDYRAIRTEGISLLCDHTFTISIFLKLIWKTLHSWSKKFKQCEIGLNINMFSLQIIPLKDRYH